LFILIINAYYCTHHTKCKSKRRLNKEKLFFIPHFNSSKEIVDILKPVLQVEINKLRIYKKEKAKRKQKISIV